MRVIKSQVNDEKSDVVALTHAETDMQPSIVSDATCGALICNGKSDEKIEDTIRLVNETTTVDGVPSAKPAATARKTNPTTSFTPLPPQTFKGEWKERFEVGMRVELLTSTRGYLPAIVTSICDMPEKYDIKLDNGDVVLCVGPPWVRISRKYFKQIKGIPPLRFKKTVTMDTSNPTNPDPTATTATATAATNVSKKDEPPDVEIVLFGILVMLMVLVAVIYFK